MLSIDQLMDEMLSLPSVSRAILADRLVASLEFDTDSTTQNAWITETQRRGDEVRGGLVHPIMGEEALKQVRQLLEPWDMSFIPKLCMTNRFPYGILYVIEPDYILILIILPITKTT